VVVYYVIALALFMPVSCREVLRCLLEGVRWLVGPETPVKAAGKSGISQARTRLGGGSAQVARPLGRQICDSGTPIPSSTPSA